jgi:DNA-binding MarR family transcriptional regulator
VPDSAESEAARDDYALEIEQGVAVLYRASKARVKRLVEHLDPEMQTAGYLVLRYVIANEPIRAGDVAAGLSMDKSAVSRQLTALRETGLIEAQPDPEDGRASLVVASQKATKRLDEFRVPAHPRRLGRRRHCRFRPVAEEVQRVAITDGRKRRVRRRALPPRG